jgi:hypothetical protein
MFANFGEESVSDLGHHRAKEFRLGGGCRLPGWLASQDFCRAAFVAGPSIRPQAGPQSRPAPQGKNVL